MKKLLLATLLATFGSTLHAQIVAFSGFEASGDTWTGVTLTGTPGSFATATGSGDTPANQRIFQGSRSWQTNNGTSTVDFDSIDLSSFVGLSFELTLRVSSTSASAGNGSDGADYVRAFVAINGNSLATNTEANATINLFGNTNARWGYTGTLTASTAVGTNLSLAAPQGGTNTNNTSTFRITAPVGTTSLDLRLIALNNDANEFWNVDSVTLTAVPEPHEYAIAFAGLLGVLILVRRRQVPRRS